MPVTPSITAVRDGANRDGLPAGPRGDRTTDEDTGCDPTADSTMRAILHDGYGTSEVLRVGRTERPTPRDNEVLMEVRAAGLDRGTEHLLTGKPYAVRVRPG